MYKLLKYVIVAVIIFSLSACENPLEDKVNSLESELANQRTEQENQKQLIESLISQLMVQQNIIDSLNNSQREYSDSLNSELKDLLEMQAQTIQLLIDNQPETGNDYLRIDSLQICWGKGTTNENGREYEFPIAFSEPPIVQMTMNIGHTGTIFTENVGSITNHSAIFYYGGTSGERSFSYCAFGKWK